MAGDGARVSGFRQIWRLLVPGGLPSDVRCMKETWRNRERRLPGIAAFFLCLVMVACTVASDGELAARRNEVTEFFDGIDWPEDYRPTGESTVRDPDLSPMTRQPGTIDRGFDHHDRTRREIRDDFDDSLTSLGLLRVGHEPCAGDGSLALSYQSEFGIVRVRYSPERGGVSAQLIWGVEEDGGQGIEEAIEVPLEECDA